MLLELQILFLTFRNLWYRSSGVSIPWIWHDEVPIPKTEAIIYSSQLAMVCFPEIVLEFHIHDICDLTLKTFHLVDQSESISQNYQNWTGFTPEKLKAHFLIQRSKAQSTFSVLCFSVWNKLLPVNSQSIDKNVEFFTASDTSGRTSLKSETRIWVRLTRNFN